MFMDAVGKNKQTIGDDLLMKVYQIGSITEATAAAVMSTNAG